MLINIAGTHFGHIYILHIHIFRVYVVSGCIYFKEIIFMNDIYVIQAIWHTLYGGTNIFSQRIEIMSENYVSMGI